MACGCIETVNSMLADRNTRLHLPIALSLGGGNYDTTPRVFVETEQVEKGRGKKKAVSMFATFCPFCGVLYSAEAAE
jgi:hypothetical protein